MPSTAWPRAAACRARADRSSSPSVQTLEKIPRAIELTSRGISGHGSVPLKSNAVVHLAAAVAKVAAWKPQIRLNDTTRAYFKRLAAISSPEDAKRYLDVIGADASRAAAADDYFLEREPRHASMLRTSVSPTIIQGGYRLNVIPSEAKASLDVRTHPDEDLNAFLARDEEGHRRSRRRRRLGRPRRAAAVRHGAARFGRLQGDRGQRHQALQNGHAADDVAPAQPTWPTSAPEACSVSASVR